MKKTIFTLAAVATLFLGACKKDKDDNNNPGGKGDSYQPVTAGSVWKYRNTSFGEGASVDTSTNTMLAETKNVNGKTYHILNSVTGDETSQGFIGVNGSVYSMYYEAGLNEAIALTYLNDAKNAGDNWTEDLVVQDGETEFTVKVKTTIVEKGISKNILGKNYSNVIHSKVELQVELEEGEWETLSQLDFYVAKGVGIIGIYSKFGDEDVSKSELFNYNIK
ncbi:hypothetical protein EOD41_07460 [Mucilaginibacter limnophilus]|uniref:Uncharacterized protein n=1 Tax=Mucilaginibacter limnophilus TaxID=1932778 RepID=A0A3S2WZH3_9SPHI|nr:hypothetical protein [Mucilaginibacter limnophilus]RVU01786.1 hypothetical protein EOD41_07460 [Mucilaginibacter limnophilus]